VQHVALPLGEVFPHSTGGGLPPVRVEHRFTPPPLVVRPPDASEIARVLWPTK
jgi:hypothetical protein